MNELWRLFFVTGVIFILAAGILFILSSMNIPRLPGDILIHKKNFTFYFPIGTSILLSIVLSLFFYFLKH